MSKVRLDSKTCEFRCPGCGQWHILPIGEDMTPRWDFSGDADSPTLAPSIAARGVLAIYDEEGDWTGEYILDAAGNPTPYVCHSFVRGGRIEFLSDCTHSLTGKTIDLPEMAPA